MKQRWESVKNLVFSLLTRLYLYQKKYWYLKFVVLALAFVFVDCQPESWYPQSKVKLGDDIRGILEETK